MEFVRNMVLKLINGDLPEEPHASTTPNIIAFGNVLLDLTVQINDTEILDRYGLHLESKGEIDAKTLTKITEEVRNSLNNPAHAGGSSLNSVRILKQLGSNALFFGAIGNDSNGEILRHILDEAGINVSFQIIPEFPTGQCVCFILGDKTALYANIGASSEFTSKHLLEAEANLKFLHDSPEKTQIFYIEGFFIPNRLEVCHFIVENYISGSNHRFLALNLNAPYVIEENFEAIKYLLGHSLFIFGNRREFLTLAKKFNCTGIVDFANELLLPKAKSAANVPRKILVVTNGSKDVELITNYGKSSDGGVRFQTFNVPKVSGIVDTTGAGDSFVAGFLHSFIKEFSLEVCVEAASEIACKVVTQVGCNLPLEQES